jgi:pyruvate/2-oxoglutarate dehydrogenase complex dihydrolipoamide acyltransferase (E2) component
VQDKPTRTNWFSLSLSQLIQLLKLPPSPARQLPYPKLRNSILDIMAEGRRKNIVHLLFEAGITPMQQHLARHREETGERISLTTYLAKSLACAIDEDRSMHAYRHGKSKLVLFDEIDLAVMMERETEHGPLPVVHIVRAANRKSIEAIHREIKAAKVAPLGEHGPMSALEKQFFELPFLLRKFVWFFIRRDPNLFKQLAGTVGVTSMGRHDSGPATALPITPMTLTLTIGLIDTKLVLENGHPVERESIQLNLSADHDIIDGAPLVRFVDRFKKKLENGSALDSPPSTP